MGSTPKMLPVSNEQFNIMLDFMQKNPDLFFGKVTEKFTAQMKKALWALLAEKLNSTESGCQKTVGKWTKTWNLWKSTVKRRAETIKKYQMKGVKLPSAMKTLSDVEERCFALIQSNDLPYDSDDDCSKEASDTTEKNSLVEGVDDTGMHLDTPDAMQEDKITMNNSSDASKENSSISVSEDSTNFEKKPNLVAMVNEDSSEPFTSDDSLPKANSLSKVIRSSFPRYDYTPVGKMRLSFAKRMRLSSAKRMRLSAPDKIKVSGSRKMKATTPGRMKLRASDRITDYDFNRLQEYVSATVKKSAAEKMQKYASERMNPRVEIIKGYVSARKREFPREEKQSAVETGASKEKSEELVAQKNRNSVSEKMVFAEGRPQNLEPEKVMNVGSDKINEVKKMADVVLECVHGTLSEDWKNAIVEKLKDVITEKMTDVIAEKVKDAISDRVEKDISITLKDAMSKLPKDSVAENTKIDTIVPTKEVASADIANATGVNEMNAGCGVQITDVRSIKDTDELTKLDKRSEELEGTPKVVAEVHKRLENSIKSPNKFTANERYALSELSDIKMEDISMDLLEKGKRAGHDEESSSDEEMFGRPPSKKRIKYTENVVGELRLLQSSRLERLDSINRTLKSNACAMVVLSKTIDNNTDAINNLAKAINNAGSLFLTSFD